MALKSWLAFINGDEGQPTNALVGISGNAVAVSRHGERLHVVWVPPFRSDVQLSRDVSAVRAAVAKASDLAL